MYRKKSRYRRRNSKFKFYKHLQFFLMFNGGLLFFSLLSGNPIGILPIWLWGMGLSLHYLSVFRPWEPRQRNAGLLRQESSLDESEEEMELVELKKRVRTWEENDLV